MKTIDLRSDTVTKPSKEMLSAMAEAEVGDDVFGEDPTVNLLQEKIAKIFGKESAIFVPSGTMGNELAIKVHTQPGDEVIVDLESHIFMYETAGASFLSGVQLRPADGVDGLLTAKQIRKLIRSRAYFLPPTKLICLENTHGRSGGTIFPLEHIQNIHEMAKDYKIKMHLDGARLWNACVVTKIQPREYAQYFDTVSVCFSKGLGAPIGSMLIGAKDVIDKARKYRKMWGAGMRQVGVLAAACLYALDNNVERLQEDHKAAAYFAEGISDIKSLHVDRNFVQTNIVLVMINKLRKPQQEILNELRENGVLMTPERHDAIRAVTHMDVSMDDVKQAVEVFHKLF